MMRFAVFGLHSYQEQLYSVPSLTAFTLQIFNWANIDIERTVTCQPHCTVAILTAAAVMLMSYRIL